MYLENKKVLVLGLGVTGLATVKALNHLGARIVISDTKPESELTGFFKEIKGIYVEKHLGTNKLDLEDIDLIVKSPGIPPEVEILLEANRKNIEIITDIELAYRISKTDNIVAITGTNGKTTTTTLVGEILRQAKQKTYITGNIGLPILEDMINSKKEDIFIIEASSFQLDNTVNFRPKVSLIINIRPDHLDWHGSLENYIKAKKNIFRNQKEDDFTVLNYDDKLIREMASETSSKIIWFSTEEELDNGVFIQDNNIIIKKDNNIIKNLSYSNSSLIAENVLASIAIAWSMGIDFEIIERVIMNFKGLEHRIEYVRKVEGVTFYNDSKGTNPDASIKAIETVDRPIILIAGGYDKDSEFDELVSVFDGKVKELILLGATKNKIEKTAQKYGFTSIHLVEDMKEAVELAYKLGKEGDNVLLSPACASMDMYNNFEDRGLDFKNKVYTLGEK